MAIDSAKKRASVLGVVLSDGTIDQFDRQTICGIYGGILAGAAVVVAGVRAGMSLPMRYLMHGTIFKFVV